MKIIKTIAMAVLALGIFACGSKKEAGSESASKETNSLYGTWVVAKAEGPAADTWIGAKCIFDENNMAMNEVPYPYTMRGDTLIAKEMFGNAKYTYKFVNDQLLLANIANGQSWVMDKK
jgi:hypothetical protein